MKHHIKNQRNTPLPHLSIESYHKLNRASNVAFHMHLHIRKCKCNAAPLLWIPDIFSYISEDISDVLQEVEDMGICRNYLKPISQE